MTLDTYHAALLCECHELVLKSLIARSHHEAYVHERTVFLGSCSHEERVAVDLIIEDGSLLLVHLVDSLYTAHFLDPLESLVHHED